MLIGNVEISSFLVQDLFRAGWWWPGSPSGQHWHCGASFTHRWREMGFEEILKFHWRDGHACNSVALVWAGNEELTGLRFHTCFSRAPGGGVHLKINWRRRVIVLCRRQLSNAKSEMWEHMKWKASFNIQRAMLGIWWFTLSPDLAQCFVSPAARWIICWPKTPTLKETYSNTNTPKHETSIVIVFHIPTNSLFLLFRHSIQRFAEPSGNRRVRLIHRHCLSCLPAGFFLFWFDQNNNCSVKFTFYFYIHTQSTRRTFLLFSNTTTGQDLSIDTARCLHRSSLFLNTTTGQDLCIDTARCLQSFEDQMCATPTSKKSVPLYFIYI